MENNEIENVNSETTQNQTVNTTDLTVDDYNKLAAEKAELEKKNAQLYARLKKEEKESSEKKTPLVETPSSEFTQELAKLKLKVDHGITDPEAIDFVMKNGGEESLKNPYIKTAVDTILQQKRAEQAIVQEDSSKSDVERKYSTAQLKAMPSDELEKILPHA